MEVEIGGDKEVTLAMSLPVLNSEKLIITSTLR